MEIEIDFPSNEDGLRIKSLDEGEWFVIVPSSGILYQKLRPAQSAPYNASPLNVETETYNLVTIRDDAIVRRVRSLERIKLEYC